jgi:pilus assembly protein CpaC
MRMTRRSPLPVVVTLMAMLLTLAPVTRAQMPAAFTGHSDRPTVGSTLNASQLRLLVGRSAIISSLRPIARVSLTTPDVADALVTAPQQVLVHGKAPGTISLFIWDRSGAITNYEVVVERDISLLVEQMSQLFPGESIEVRASGRDVVLAGTVTSRYVVEKAAEVAGGYVDKKEEVVNLLRQEEGATSNQILLRVRFAEVTRSALSELGATLFSSGHQNFLGRTTTQQFSAPDFESQDNGGIKTVFSDFLNLFLFDADNQLGMVVKAMQNKGLLQSLAEPNLIAQNGKEASFLAGGEYPYPSVQGTGSAMAVTVAFKEYGIRLTFTPTILRDDVIHLKVRPEVSALDFSNAVSIQGFRIPALTSRRAETEVELRDGQTFAIAGLLNNSLTEAFQKVPGIGDIPILGLLFRSRAMQKAETELVVMITPQILRRNSTGVTSELPRLEKPFLEPPSKTEPMPAPRTPGQGLGPNGSGQPGSPAPEDALTALQEASAILDLSRDEKKALAKLEEAEKKRQEALQLAEREAARRAADDAERVRKEEARLARERAEADQQALGASATPPRQ